MKHLSYADFLIRKKKKVNPLKPSKLLERFQYSQFTEEDFGDKTILYK